MTNKQKKFVAEYGISGNATQAAINAGYSKKSAYSIGAELLKKPEIRNALQLEITDKVATRNERQLFWSSVMNDEEEDMKNRLRASELLAKSCGDFLERQEVVNYEYNDKYDLSKLNEEELLQLKDLLTKATPDEFLKEGNEEI